MGIGISSSSARARSAASSNTANKPIKKKGQKSTPVKDNTDDGIGSAVVSRRRGNGVTMGEVEEEYSSIVMSSTG